MEFVLEHLLSRLIPFVMAALIVVLAVVGLIVISNLLVIAFIFGGVLFLLGVIKQKLFPSSTVSRNPQKSKKDDTGRIIEGEKVDE